MRGKKTIITTSLAGILAFLCLSLLVVSPVIGQDGKKLYGDRCALCHGPDGDGKGVIMQTAPFGADFWKANDDAAISKAIIEGKGRMPAIPLSPEEAKAVVDYMKSSLKK
jgi:mono/diheme cytochrome c family protein